MVSPKERNPKLDNFSPEKLINIFRTLRSQRDEAKKEFVQSQAPTLELMRQVEVELLDRLNKQEANSFSTDSGTASRKTTRKLSAPDFSAFLAWVRENGHYEFLEPRPHKSEVLAWCEDGEETRPLPPGLSLNSEIDISITAPKRKPK